MRKHYLIFIHGMSEQSPCDRYDYLWKNIIKTSPISTSEFKKKFSRIYIKWRVDPLQNAANTIYNSAFPNLIAPSVNPMHGIRSFMTFSLGDVIAYVSEDVNLIRRTVWEQIWEQLEQPLNQGATYSIVAHSLGAVIAFDYLFHLFDSNSEDHFAFIPDLKDSISRSHLTLLRQQFRDFFTMGAPIGLFMLRKGSLWMEGEPFTSLINPVCGENRAWYNFWDSEDAIAYPLAELFERNPKNSDRNLIDVPVETGFLVFDSHANYWSDRDIARVIANQLKAGGRGQRAEGG